MGILEKKVETTIMGYMGLGWLRVQGSGLRVHSTQEYGLGRLGGLGGFGF